MNENRTAAVIASSLLLNLLQLALIKTFEFAYTTIVVKNFCHPLFLLLAAPVLMVLFDRY